MITKESLYANSAFQVGNLIDAKKIVETRNNGALTAYYILNIKYISGITHEHFYYPDDTILNLIGQNIFFDIVNTEKEKYVLHIYKSGSDE